MVGWKTPWAGYQLHEVEFCKCEAGTETQAYWQARSKSDYQQRLDRMFESAGVPVLFRELTLDSYEQIANGDPGKIQGIAAAKSIVEHGQYQSRNSLFVTGAYGAGKTGLLTPVLRHWIDQGKSGMWIEFYDFTDEIQARYAAGGAAEALDTAKAADWVLLDDVGDLHRNHGTSGFSETTDKQRILYQLINHRHNHALPTLITTNLSPSEFSQQFGARTMERIAESFAIVNVGGRNLRMNR